MPTTRPSFCTNCGAALTQGAAFCEQCGQPIGGAGVAPPAPVTPPPVAVATPPPRPAKSGCRSCATVLFVILLAGVGAGVIYREAIMDAIARLTKALPVAPPSPASINSTPPVEVAYIHFLDEAHRRLGGELQVGSPVQTSTRIEVAVTTQGKTERLVVVEQSNDGTRATVLVGPKDAGAVRSYTLVRGTDGWSISAMKELDG